MRQNSPRNTFTLDETIIAPSFVALPINAIGDPLHHTVGCPVTNTSECGGGVGMIGMVCGTNVLPT